MPHELGVALLGQVFGNPVVGLVHWTMDPDVSWMIMKYGFAGGGQSAGFGDKQF